MSNESNRAESHTIHPGELQASDFFPPGSGWNKEACDTDELKRKAAQFERAHDGDVDGDGSRSH